MFTDFFASLTTTTSLVGLGAGLLKSIYHPKNIINLGSQSLNTITCGLGGLLLGGCIEYLANKFFAATNEPPANNTSAHYQPTSHQPNHGTISSPVDISSDLGYCKYKVSLAAITVGAIFTPTIASVLQGIALIPLYLAPSALIIGEMIWCIKKGYQAFEYLVEGLNKSFFTPEPAIDSDIPINNQMNDNSHNIPHEVVDS